MAACLTLFSLSYNVQSVFQSMLRFFGVRHHKAILRVPILARWPLARQRRLVTAASGSGSGDRALPGKCCLCVPHMLLPPLLVLLLGLLLLTLLLLRPNLVAHLLLHHHLLAHLLLQHHLLLRLQTRVAGVKPRMQASICIRKTGMLKSARRKKSRGAQRVGVD